MASVEESDVGILCYISRLPGFRGILKQRYSDFIVNEVGLDGNIVHLTSLDAPLAAEEKNEKAVDLLDKDYGSEIESFRALAGDSDGVKLKIFIDQITSGANGSQEDIVLTPSSNKSHRTAIHNFFKEKLKFLVTDTVDGPDSLSKCIRVRLDRGSTKGRGRNSNKRKDRGDKLYDSRGSDDWPEQTGKFLRFHLYKENKDTQEAIGVLAKMLGIQPRSFGFAGTKDKRSVSTQRVTVFKQKASRVAALNEKLFGIKVGNFCHVNEGLVLGQLQGNRFTIILRKIYAESDDIIKASATALKKSGFINYFGLQRFGSSSIPTHLVGAALLRGEWKAAVGFILDPREGDILSFQCLPVVLLIIDVYILFVFLDKDILIQKDSTRKVREYYKHNGDIEGTLRQLPRHLVAERAILHYLEKHPGNYLQALLAIPRTLRMMFVHSYQSYLWNNVASIRVQKYGTDQVVLGDLAYCRGQETENEMISIHLEGKDGSGADANVNCHLDDISITDFSELKNTSVKVLNEEDISAGNYTIDDIVLPLPGSRITYPLNDTGKIYHELAEKDGISLTTCAHNSKEFSLANMTGAYRRVFQKPKDFQWELLKYTDMNKPLTETDWEILAKSCAATSGKTFTEDEITHQAALMSKADKFNDEIELSVSSLETRSDVQGYMKIQETLGSSETQESHIALRLSFTLPASCYATMAIRELLKTSSSVAFHKALTHLA